MRTASLTTLTTQAWNQMVALLFRPIRWKIWLKLLLIAWLSGYLGQGGCQGNFNGLSQPNAKYESSSSRARGKTIKPKEVSKPYTYDDLQKDIHNVTEEAARYAIFIVAGIAFFLALIALMAWLSARFSFVFVDVLTSGQIAIIEPFKRNREVAWSYFLWILGFSLFVFAILILTIWMAGLSILHLYAATPHLRIENFFEDHLWEIFSVLIRYILGMVVFFLLSGIAGIWSRDFIVPIMFQMHCNVIEGWKNYLREVRASPWEAVKYILWRWLIGIAFVLVYVIAFIGIMAIVVIIGVISFLIGAGVTALIPALKWPLIILGCFLGVLLMFALFFVSLLSMLPAGIWFRFFSLRYLQSLNMGCHFFNDTPPLPPAALRN